MYFNRRTSFSLWLIVVGFLVGCAPKSTPPGANSIGGGVEEARFSYHYWEEGLAILIWHDLTPGGEGCSGTGSTEDPVYTLECDIESTDRQSFSWNVRTQDGVTADMWLDGQNYDLAQGNMFLVSSQNGGIQVEQHKRDFSELDLTVEAISALSSSDPAIAKFIAGNHTAVESSMVDNKEGLEVFIAALQSAGQPVEIAGMVDQPFFSVPGQIVVLNGEEVQVFEYPDSASAAAESAQISPTGSSVGTSMITWVATPHFYIRNRIIVLYVGDNESVTNILASELGEPIAEGQSTILPQPGDSTAESEEAEENILTGLADALTNHDFIALEELMGETFIIGYWLSEGQTLTSAQAVEQLRVNLLPDPSGVSFIHDRAQFPDLGGIDPMTAFGPEVQIVDLVYSQGWGADGRGEAILTIAEDADSHQYWQGVIYASDGFALTPEPLKTATLLSNALATADYETLQELMGETFAIGYWLSEGQTLTPAQAVEQLRLNLLPNPAAVSFIQDRSQFPDLDGVDPVTVFGPDVQIVDLVYSQGWGPDGLDEAILTIAQNPDGSQYWQGIIYGRFAGLAETPVQESPSYETVVYQNSENGFELDYPASWHLDEQVLGSRGSGALFYAADTDEEPIFTAVVYLWDPMNDLDAWVDMRKQSWSGSGATVLSEEGLTVDGGHRAIQFELQWLEGQTTNHFFVEVGERYLELFGVGDLEIFGEIIETLQFVESDS